ncbi:hypothetical protein [Streptomyces sp. NPDC004266]|uniref:hypothetical protein n=1 Tax=Streptomyces sp. NPDC004266 TaxID=3364693 RepID=UPI0036C792C6
MSSTGLEGEDVEYEVVLRFRPGGPAVLGVWSTPEVADEKFLKWLGAHEQSGTVLTITATLSGGTRPVSAYT